MYLFLPDSPDRLNSPSEESLWRVSLVWTRKRYLSLPAVHLESARPFVLSFFLLFIVSFALIVVCVVLLVDFRDALLPEL